MKITVDKKVRDMKIWHIALGEQVFYWFLPDHVHRFKKTNKSEWFQKVGKTVEKLMKDLETGEKEVEKFVRSHLKKR